MSLSLRSRLLRLAIVSFQQPVSTIQAYYTTSGNDRPRRGSVDNKRRWLTMVGCCSLPAGCRRHYSRWYRTVNHIGAGGFFTGDLHSSLASERLATITSAATTEILYSPFIYYMSKVRSLRHTVPSAPSWTTVIQFSIAWGLTALACLSSTPHHGVSKTGKLKLSQYSLWRLTDSHAKLLQRHSSINTSSIFYIRLSTCGELTFSWK